MKFIGSNWSLVVIPGSTPPRHLASLWNETYRTWHEVWQEAFKELEGEGKLYSDEFTRQHDILAVFEGEKCLLSIFFKKVDVTATACRDDSYFKVWPEECFQYLVDHYDGQIIVGSNTTVAKDVRGTYKDISLKRLLTGLSIHYLCQSELSGMVGTMRNNKGMNTVTYEAGAILLKPNLMHHGVEVDLVVFDKDTLAQKPHQYQPLIEDLWNRRLDYRLPFLSSAVKRAA